MLDKIPETYFTPAVFFFYAQRINSPLSETNLRSIMIQFDLNVRQLHKHLYGCYFTGQKCTDTDKYVVLLPFSPLSVPYCIGVKYLTVVEIRKFHLVSTKNTSLEITFVS